MAQQQTKKFLGIKWYWWILIAIVIVFILSSLSTIGITASKLGTKLAQGVLGFAGGILHALAKSPIGWALAAWLLLPFASSGASAAYTFYKNHYAEGKSTADVNKELNLDSKIKEATDKLEKQIKEGQKENEALKEQIKELKQKINEENAEKGAEALNDKRLDKENLSSQVTALNKDLEDVANEDGTDAPEVKDNDGKAEVEPGV
jgi:hypothetical protein